MPGHEALRARVLDPEDGAPAEDVRPDQLLDRVEHARIADQVVQPLEEQKSAAALRRLESAALGRFKGLELLAQTPRLFGGHDRHWTDVAVAMVLRDLLGREPHGNL